MNQAKIRLSVKEMELVKNADWILTKNGILQKVKILLEGLQVRQQEFLAAESFHLPSETLAPPPKISRGENYKGLPYLVLDFPRFFEKENFLAIRTMFWWGNFFSITLHLTGRYKSLYEQAVISSFDSWEGSGVFIGVHETEWEHHFENDNYRPVKGMTREEWIQCIHEKPFLKLGQKIPLEQWDDAQELLFRYFTRIIRMMSVQFPKR